MTQSLRLCEQEQFFPLSPKTVLKHLTQMSTVSPRRIPRTTPRRTPNKKSTPRRNKLIPKSILSPSLKSSSPPQNIIQNENTIQQQPITTLTQSKLDKIYKLVRSRTGKLGGGGAGGAIYGEVTQKSFARIVNMLKTECELDTTSTFIDIGAGLGKPNLHVALDPGVKASVGVELGGERWWQSQDILWHGMEEQVAQETGLDSLNGPIFLAHADFLEVNTLNDFSHVYMFDKGFPPVLMEHIANVFNKSSNSKYLMCFKKPRIIVDKYEFQVEEIGRVKTSMSGSGEGNTCFFYRRLPSSSKKNSKNKKKNSKKEKENAVPFTWNVPTPPTDSSVAPPVSHSSEYGQIGMAVASTGTCEEYRTWLKKQVGVERSVRRLRSRTKKTAK